MARDVDADGAAAAGVEAGGEMEVDDGEVEGGRQGGLGDEGVVGVEDDAQRPEAAMEEGDEAAAAEGRSVGAGVGQALEGLRGQRGGLLQAHHVGIRVQQQRDEAGELIASAAAVDGEDPQGWWRRVGWRGV